MTDPLKLAAWADDPQGRFDPAPVERRLIATALRLAEKIEDPWVRGRHQWWRCIICGAECEWDEESEFPGTHRPGCELAAYEAARERSPSDAERAREIAGPCYWAETLATCCEREQSRCRQCRQAAKIAEALAAARAEEREAAATVAAAIRAGGGT